jgi:hypothetical protein
LVASTHHTSSISGDITGTGLIEVLNNTTLEIDGSVASTLTLSFAQGQGATGTLVLDHSLTQAFSAVTQDATADQFTFQKSDSHSGTISASTLAASVNDPSRARRTQRRPMRHRALPAMRR